MKKLFKILTIFVIILGFTSCEKENDFNYVLSPADAPSDVEATVMVATDNSGLVTVTPVGSGASSFRIFFGDPDDTEVVIGRNLEATNVYPEGDYTIRILGVSTNGKITEVTKNISVETTAILNAENNIVVSETAREISISPSADNADTFSVDFGDGTTQTLATAETVRHTYLTGGDFDVTVTASNSENGKMFQSVENVTFNQGPLNLLLTFDDPLTDYTFNAFGGVSSEVVVNPDISGSNNIESNVAAVTNSGNAFEGFTYDLPSAIDFSGSTKLIAVNVYNNTGNALPITLQFVNGVNGERGVEVVTMHTGSGWETLEFNFFDAVNVFLPNDPDNGQAVTAIGQYGQIAMFVDGPGSTQGTFFLDDFKQLEGDGTVIIVEEPEYVFDFETEPLNGFFDFGAPIQIIDNPFAMGINTSAKVLEVQRGAGTFQGAGFSIPLLDLTTADKVVKIKFYSTIAVPISVDLKESPEGARSAAASANHTGSGWEELSFDYSNATKAFEEVNGVEDPTNFDPLPADEVGTYRQVVFIVNGPGTSAGTFYMDDIIKE